MAVSVTFRQGFAIPKSLCPRPPRNFILNKKTLGFFCNVIGSYWANVFRAEIWVVIYVLYDTFPDGIKDS